jgi:hypothetical protein
VFAVAAYDTQKSLPLQRTFGKLEDNQIAEDFLN